MNNKIDTLTQEYLEVIDQLERTHRVARVKDIALMRGVSRSSVSIALNQLAGKQLIKHEQYGHVVLTAKGKRIASNLARRHEALKYFLFEILGISIQAADDDACKMEHIMSQESLNALYRFLEFIEICPKKERDYLKYFRFCGKYKSEHPRCDNCSV